MNNQTNPWVSLAAFLAVYLVLHQVAGLSMVLSIIGGILLGPTVVYFLDHLPGGPTDPPPSAPAV